MKLVLASNNIGKLNEFKMLFAGSGIEVHPQNAWSIQDAEETGLTFIENALIKARHACLMTKLPAIADDSGLAVDALMGAPGIYSARFASRAGDAQACNEKLLRELASVPPTQRHARFHCVLVYMQHAQDPTPIIAHGIWEGVILSHPQGIGGFGYDPLFFDPVLQRSAAQLSSSEKNRVSHRGKAMRQLIHLLKDIHHVSA